jgi:beta-galactosidase/beta-glucuronidase
MFRRDDCSALSAMLLLLAGVTLTPAQEWKPAPAPLLTRWAKDVSPDRARADYPRPHWVRKEWKSLNGVWEFAFDDADAGSAQRWQSGKRLDGRILVPWTFEASLSGIGKGQEVHEHVWYRRTFDVPKDWKGKRTLLHFGAVDWESTVWVNGRKVGTHRGGYTPFSYDITDALKPAGPQEVVVAVFDPAEPAKGAFQPKGKQLGSRGIWYTRTTGIWQTVWLEPVAPVHIASARIEPDLAGEKVTLHVRLAGDEPARLRVSFSLPGEGQTSKDLVATEKPVRGGTTVTLTVPLAAPRPWSPESPTLYDVHLLVHNWEKEMDEVRTYTAFRTVTAKDGRIFLNGKPYFLRGVLDQGFWPDGVYTPPTAVAIQNEVEMTRAFGFNLARKHVKVEDPLWYYYCDKLGLLVAQDMPSSHNLKAEPARDNFVREWQEVMETVRAHPSVILWVPFNENWGDPGPFQDRIVEMTHAADPTRLVIDASGWTQRDRTDVNDLHDYGNELTKDYAKYLSQLTGPRKARPTWVGEYGGVGLPVRGHTWVEGWGYQKVRTPDALVAKYQFLTDQLTSARGLSGFVYTQLTDVEQELNGVMTYDRLPKAPPQRFAAINRAREEGR